MQIILGMYFPQTNTCPLVVTYHKCLNSIIIIQYLGNINVTNKVHLRAKIEHKNAK